MNVAYKYEICHIVRVSLREDFHLFFENDEKSFHSLLKQSWAHSKSIYVKFVYYIYTTINYNTKLYNTIYTIL